MSLPQWDDEMKFELFRLKSELRTENFRVLSAPLGLGRITTEPTSRDTLLYAPMQPLVVPLCENQGGSHVPASLPPTKIASRAATHPMALEPMDSLVTKPTFQEEQSIREEFMPSNVGRWLRPLFAHSLDLLFIGYCLSLGLLLLGWIVDPMHLTLNFDDLAQLAPLEVLKKMRAPTLLGGLYGFFTIYWLFFRFVSGQTLGENWVSYLHQDQKVLSGLSGKDSALL